MKGSAAKLGALTRELAQQWQHTKEAWQDAKCAEFERQHLQELFLSVDKAMHVIDQIDKLVTRIRSDCE
ncbi:MAG: hypothetical protein AB1813_27390 [Verrucomicrobiota bacterium]|jgi:hypothetical protein